MKPSTRASHAELVLSTLVHIQDHLDEPLTLEELAEHARSSPFHFQRLFRAFVGESPSEHIRRLRLERAAHALVYTDRPILDLAFEARYDSHEAFTRAFGVAFDMPPSSFRAQHRGAGRIESPIDAHYRGDVVVKPPALLARDSGVLEGEVRRCPALHVAFIRHIGPYEDAPLAFGRLTEWAAARNLTGTNARFLGAAHDAPCLTPPEKLRFDICLEVARGVEGEGEIGTQELAGGDYAIGTHFGPFESLKETFQWLGAEFVPQQKRVLARKPAIEVYLSDLEHTRPCDLRTEIRLPLEDQ